MEFSVSIDDFDKILCIELGRHDTIGKVYDEVAAATNIASTQWVLRDGNNSVIHGVEGVSYGDTLRAGLADCALSGAELTRRNISCTAESLSSALRAEDAGTVALLISAGCATDGALHAACESSNTELLTTLLEGSVVDLNFVQEELTALGLAVQLGKRDMVKVLLRYAVDVDTGGHTPLFLAAEQGNTEMVKDLLSRHPQCDIKGPEGLTPICVATANAHLDVVRTLLRYGSEQRRSRAGL